MKAYKTYGYVSYDVEGIKVYRLKIAPHIYILTPNRSLSHPPRYVPVLMGSYATPR